MLDGSYNLIKRGECSFLRKEIRLHPLLCEYVDEIYHLTVAYAEKMRLSGVPIPLIAESSFDESCLSFLCEYKGKNLVEYFGQNLARDFFSDEKIVAQVLSAVRSAQKHGLHFDPHLKNFVIDQGVVFYVDFSPPWGREYYDLRLSVAKKDDLKVLDSYFSCFYPDVLGYHFASDLLKMDAQCHTLMTTLYQRLLEQGSINENYEKFRAEGVLIQSREWAREVRGLFLL